MNRPRGFILPSMMEAAVVLMAVTALVSAAVLGVRMVDRHGYERGVNEQRAADLEQRAKDQAAWDAERVRLTARARAAEQQLNATVVTLTTKLTKEKVNALQDQQAELDALRRGTLVLRGHADSPTPSASGGGSASGATAAPGGPAPSAGAELSRTDAEFLLGEARRADQYTRERNAALELLTAYERACTAQ